MEKEITESTLAQVMPNLTRGQIKKANKKHGGKFAPKNRAFSILENKIEDVVNKSRQLWKTIYKITDDKDEEENKVEASTKEKIEEKKVEEKPEEENKEEEDKENEEDKEKGEEEETQKGEDMATTKQQQQEEQSVQDMQMPPPIPPHVTITPTNAITIKDVSNISSQNINPLIVEDLSKIHHQSMLQPQLCINLVLVSVDELQKAVEESKREKVKPKEPPFIYTTTSTQILMLPSPSPTIAIATDDTTQKPSAKEGKFDQKEDTSKEEEQASIQILVELPKIGTPTKVLQKSSTNAILLKISTLGSSSTKMKRVLHYGDPKLDEEIVIPSYDSKIKFIEKIIEMQEALNKRKRQEILKKEYKKRQALHEIKGIFLDA